jgi:hypothetical protein
MARPQQSTKDKWLDQFDGFDTETQEGLIDTCQLLHRLAKKREGRRPEPQQIEMRQHATGAETQEGLIDTCQLLREDLGKAGAA